MQIASGRQLADRIRRAFIAVLVLSVFAWAAAPSFTHSASIWQGLSERSQAIADHGHSHDDELDQYWTLHGHSHDMADHDHSSAILILISDAQPVTGFRLSDAPGPFLNKPDPIYRHDRPPRV